METLFRHKHPFTNLHKNFLVFLWVEIGDPNFLVKCVTVLLGAQNEIEVKLLLKPFAFG